MYEALREMMVDNPAGGYMRVQPGQEVPGFHSWPVVNQQAAINTHMVRERPEGAGPQAAGHFPTVTEKRKSFERLQPLVASAYVHTPLRPGAADAGGEQPPVIIADGTPSVVDVQAPPGVEVLSESVEEPAPELEIDNHICGECDFRAASSQGLRLHITRKHPV